MNKSDALQENVSNARPYGIFASYMSTCLALSIFIIVKLFDKTEKLHAVDPSRLPQRKQVVLFAVLAAASLLTTWSFMFRYFEWSYDNWLTVRSQHKLDPSVKHWGLWLKETSLFREAWESVIIGHDRYWWSHQIFYFASALGLHSEWKGMSYTEDVKSVANCSRCPTQHPLHLGIHAPRADRGHQLCYEHVLLDSTPEPTTAAAYYYDIQRTRIR